MRRIILRMAERPRQVGESMVNDWDFEGQFGLEEPMSVQHGKVYSETHRDDPAATPGLAQLARRPLFEPLRSLLLALPGPNPSSLSALNDLMASDGGRQADGAAMRFVAPDDMPIAYEERIVSRGEIVTRPGNWHDFFNALVWMRFPRTKYRLAALHAKGMRSPAPDGRRGPIRDAATQFDESGIVVAASDPALLELLAQRQWKALFWNRRDSVRRNMRFAVFGHGLYDALRAPFYRICGRAATIVVPQSCLDAPVDALCAHVDSILDERFAQRSWYPRPKALLALPLLGIPGVCAENETSDYYDDVVQFRPPPADELAGGCRGTTSSA